MIRLLDTHDIQYKRVEEFASRRMVFPLKITRDEELANLRPLRRGNCHSIRRSECHKGNVPTGTGADRRFVGIFSDPRTVVSHERTPALRRRLQRRQSRRSAPLS